MKFKKLKESKMSEAVASQILELIEDGSIKAGDKLPTEPELISSFGVSRTALREGMQRLLMIDAIEIRPGAGTFVKDMRKRNLLKIPGLKIIKNKKQLLEIIELRKIFESGIVELAVDRANDDDFNELQECLNMHEKDTIRDVFPAEGDAKFHKVLVLSTHNEVIINFYDDLYRLILNSVIYFSNYESANKESLEYHKKIFKAVRNRDKIKAKEYMKKHLEWLTEII